MLTWCSKLRAVSSRGIDESDLPHIAEPLEEVLTLPAPHTHSIPARSIRFTAWRTRTTRDRPCMDTRSNLLAAPQAATATVLALLHRIAITVAG